MFIFFVLNLFIFTPTLSLSFILSIDFTLLLHFFNIHFHLLLVIQHNSRFFAFTFCFDFLIHVTLLWFFGRKMSGKWCGLGMLWQNYQKSCKYPWKFGKTIAFLVLDILTVSWKNVARFLFFSCFGKFLCFLRVLEKYSAFCSF